MVFVENGEEFPKATPSLHQYLAAGLCFLTLSVVLYLATFGIVDFTEMSFGTPLDLLELAATAVFATTGAGIALKYCSPAFKGLRRDTLICAAAFLTANGGGTLRDILAGSPIFWVESWVYWLMPLLIGLAASRLNVDLCRDCRAQVSIMDNFSAGVFASLGVLKAATMIAPGEPGFAFLATTMGALTAVGGGAIRDIFVLRRVPYIFVSNYGIAAAIGAYAQAQLMSIGQSSGVELSGFWFVGIVAVFVLNETTKDWNPSLRLARAG